ncbi:MAG: nitroreductase family protein [Ferrimonas sp.]
MHEVIRDLTWRYTTKKYDPHKRISAADIEIIKESLRLSASSINSQPWKFLLLESEQAKQRFHHTFAIKYQFNQLHALDASHTILMAYNPHYTKLLYRGIVDEELQGGRLPLEQYQNKLNGSYRFVDLHTNEAGFNGHWTKAQLYLALGNIMHVLARLKIDSTPMEGVDTALISQEFASELDGYVCPIALAMGYHLDGEDYNRDLAKIRRPMDAIFTTL